ncbi:MAG: peptidogalycan biosysnthesis protein, partial [Pseudomonadota bacterium]
MQVESCDSLANVPAEQWNALTDGRNPFVRHEFLLALENNGCVAAEYGWHPFHLLLKNDQGTLIAAAPAYAKTNSYGEFVFDWAWADAYERAGGQYYPKLICAVPFTPATGPRLLVNDEQKSSEYAVALYDAAIAIVEQQSWSGVHWLFPPEQQASAMEKRKYMLRIGCQYIWSNDNYRDFEDFLSRCTAKKRKNMRRERRRVAEQDVSLTVMHGDELSDDDWHQVTNFYLDTFNRK